MSFLNKISGSSNSNLAEICAAKRIEIFKEEVTPVLKNIGLNKWDGKYTWFSDFNKDGIKHVVYYQVLKGARGSFSYGNCFSFVPTVSNGRKLINHRTDKSTLLHLWERLDGWKDSFEGTQRINYHDMIQHWNEKIFRKTLEEILIKYQPRIEQWFENHKKLSENISLARNQIEIGGAYNVNGPAQKYVLAFLTAVKGDYEGSMKYVHDYYDPLIERNRTFEDEMQLVLNRINKIKSDVNNG